MPAELTLNQLLQLYAPMVAIMGAFFWMGVLSQRVTTLERERREDKATATSRDTLVQADHDTLVRMSQDMENMAGGMERLGTEMTSVQRQLANLAARGAGGIHTLNQGGIPQ